jgi:ubiquinone/menaquinone biosynthesis C-methylase UbiE
MTKKSKSVEIATGELFGDLWHAYDKNLFEESVQLFEQRANANDFDLNWLSGKICLDAGCGGGRYSVALARHGAKSVVGADVSSSGLMNAKLQASRIPNIQFCGASVLDLPFADQSYDLVWCAGVLHHTRAPAAGLSELVRVLKSGGRMFLLLYGKGGVRWPTMMKLRPLAEQLGYDALDSAIGAAGLPANTRRTFLDDLFVPLINFYDQEEVAEMLAQNGIMQYLRWENGKLDHEQSVPVQRGELIRLKSVFDHADCSKQAASGSAIVSNAIKELDEAEASFENGTIDIDERNWRVFGVGHHRVMCEKP